MAIYRFKVSFENYDDVFREIDIRSDQTFEDFFYAIQQSIGFDHQHEASFYISNDQWKLGQLISSDSGNKNAIALKDAVMHDWVNDPHQKIYYSYDPKSDWTFYIELVRILMKEDLSMTYPACIKVYGDAPVQYIRQPAPSADETDVSDKLLSDLLKGMHISEEEEIVNDSYEEENDRLLDAEDDDAAADGFGDDEDSGNEPTMDEDDDQREY